MSFLLTLTKRAKNERTKRNFFKNTLPAASDHAGCCHGHGLGLHPPLLLSRSHAYPGNTEHRSAIVGVAVFELLKAALQYLGVDANAQYIAIGIVIFVAISLDIRKYVAKK